MKRKRRTRRRLYHQKKKIKEKETRCKLLNERFPSSVSECIIQYIRLPFRRIPPLQTPKSFSQWSLEDSLVWNVGRYHLLYNGMKIKQIIKDFRWQNLSLISTDSIQHISFPMRLAVLFYQIDPRGIRASDLYLIDHSEFPSLDDVQQFKILGCQSNRETKSKEIQFLVWVPSNPQSTWKKPHPPDLFAVYWENMTRGTFDGGLNSWWLV